MDKTIYLCGHGSWKPNDGYFNMPAGCTLTFIVHHSKCLYTTDMYKVCEGSWNGEPLTPIEEYKSCPNMTWTVDDPKKKIICEDRLGKNPNHDIATNPALVIFPSKTKTLKEFFRVSYPYIRMDNRRYDKINFIWNCCTALELRPTKFGGKIGINAAEAFDKYDYVDFTGNSPKFLNIHKTK